MLIKDQERINQMVRQIGTEKEVGDKLAVANLLTCGLLLYPGSQIRYFCMYSHIDIFSFNRDQILSWAQFLSTGQINGSQEKLDTNECEPRYYLKNSKWPCTRILGSMYASMEAGFPEHYPYHISTYPLSKNTPLISTVLSAYILACSLSISPIFCQKR